MALNESRLDFEGMIVTADLYDEAPQPWSGKPSFRYIVRISAREGDYFTYAYGSQRDYEAGVNDVAEEMAWMILHDLLSASCDPEEFWELSACGEPDALTIERARGILEVIDYADKISERLEANRDEIEEA